MVYSKVLRFFGLKYRSAPNRHNWFEYFIFCLSPLNYCTIDQVAGLVIIVILISFKPLSGFITASLYMAFILYSKNEKTAANELNPAEIVYFIQAKHQQSLKEKLEFDPSLARMNYRGKSMLYWCKYYKNQSAHSLIIKAMKEH